MALSYRRLLYKVGTTTSRSQPLIAAQSKRFFSDEGGESLAKPYQPWPTDEYRYQANANFWIQKGYRPQDAASDAAGYEQEELHLHEIEARLERYGKKYSVPDRCKNLWNEYAWYDDDDRPFSVYGAAFGMSEHEEEKWGPGKKINVTHYLHSGFIGTNRQPIPPLSYMGAEQIRRVRGRLARFKEWPQEIPSIWKSHNPYITVLAITGIGTAKELFFFNSHDFKELFYLWGTWAFVMSVGFDWLMWFTIGRGQEEYDRMFLPLHESVKETDKWLNRFDALPNFTTVLTDLGGYRKDLSERVLQRTLSNRVREQLDKTVTKLEQKMTEERAAEASIQSEVRRQAVAATLKYFDDPKVQQDFTAMVVKDFSAGTAAKLVSGATGVTIETGLFEKRFESDLKTSEKRVFDEARKNGTLPWRFRSDDEKAKAKMSPADKEKEFKARIDAWAATHNPVNAQFA